MHPAVQNVACVPMPYPILGERMCAYVIPKANAEITFDALVEFLSGMEMARHKMPERLEVVDTFPLSNFGKVSKKDLMAEIAAKLAAEATS
jgi:2,3-dihydroxybenzoate-AMP ligase